MPSVKKNGYVMIAMPGLKKEPEGKLKELFCEWTEGDDSELFKTVDWRENLLTAECGDSGEVSVVEADCYDIAWQAGNVRQSARS